MVHALNRKLVFAGLIAVAAPLTACGIIDAGVEQATGAAEITLQTPSTLNGVPQLDNANTVDPNVNNQPPGASTVIAAYGRNSIPLLTLQAYAGLPAAVSVVQSAYEQTVGGDVTGDSRCNSQARLVVTCWRTQDNLLVAVTSNDGRAPADTAAVVNEAWTSVRQ